MQSFYHQCIWQMCSDHLLYAGHCADSERSCEKAWHDHSPLPPFCLSAQGWESFHAQNYLPFAHSNCEEGPLLPICLMKKLSMGTSTQSHVCWKVEDPDQNSQLADARALIFWGPWVPLGFSFQALVSLSVCQGGERGNLGGRPVMWVSGRRARSQWRLGKGGAPPAQPPRDSPGCRVWRWFLLLAPNDFCIHVFAAF